MSELRKDPFSGRFVIVAPERQKRPTDYLSRMYASSEVCPFCPGNEHLTPPEVMAIRPAGSERDKPGWSLRVVPNRFPALLSEATLGLLEDGPYEKWSGFGAHEVIIESPSHEETFSTLSLIDLETVLHTYQDRIRSYKNESRMRYVSIHKNHAEAAGATLSHPHSQLVALPMVPQSISAELESCRVFFESRKDCLFCDILNHELTHGERVILRQGNLLALSPYAPRFPFETWIVPKGHQASFEEMGEPDLEELALTFSETFKRLDRVLNQPAYNLMLHTAPFNNHDSVAAQGFYHWHFEILPMVTRAAGFEWGTGYFINAISPEEAARRLREEEPY